MLSLSCLGLCFLSLSHLRQPLSKESITNPDPACTFLNWLYHNSAGLVWALAKHACAAPVPTSHIASSGGAPNRNLSLALLVCALVLLAAAAAWWLVGRFAGPPRARLARLLGWNKEEEQNKETSRPRLRSLDTFRGIAISLMIFVNDGG